MKRTITVALAVLTTLATAVPALSLEGRHAEEFYDGMGNKLSERHADEFYEGMGNKLSERHAEEFYEGMGNKGH
ncbi:MAG: hypothetical protein AAF289_02860 [Cyanobacteria bacterium P01_A01_bin.135]